MVVSENSPERLRIMRHLDSIIVMNRSSVEWRIEMLALWPWEIEELYVYANERESPIIVSRGFLLGMFRALQDHGFYNRFLTDDQHQKSLDFSRYIARLIYQVFADDKEFVEKFKAADQFALETGEVAGWPKPSHQQYPDEEIEAIVRLRREQDQLSLAKDSTDV